MNNKISTYNTVLELLYLGIREPTYWEEFLKEVRKLLECDNASFLVTNHNAPSLNHSLTTFEESFFKNYMHHYANKDAWTLGILEKGISYAPVIDGEELIADRDLIKTEFYTDCIREAGVRYTMASILQSNENQTIAFTTNRSMVSGRASQDDKKWMELLAPHLKHAGELSTILSSAQLSASSMSEKQKDETIAIFTFNESGDINSDTINIAPFIKANLLNQQKDTFFAGHNLSQLVRSFIEKTDTQTQISELVIPLRDRKQEINFLLKLKKTNEIGAVSLFQQTNLGKQTVLAIITNLKSPDLAARRFANFFSLSTREFDILLALAKGFTLPELSLMLCISKETARVHLKRIFLKSNVNSQAELLHLVNSLND